MHQPKRGLVNSLLEPGIDITDRVDDLYAGPGGWSQAPDVGRDRRHAVGRAARPSRSERVFAGVAAGVAARAATPTCCWTRRTPRTCSRSTRCSTQGVKRHAARRRHGARSRAPPAPLAPGRGDQARRRRSRRRRPRWSGAPLDKVVVAYTGGSEVRDTLAALGFEGRAVTATTLATTLTADVDVLLVGAHAEPGDAERGQPRGLDAFIARGGGVVGLGTAGSAFTTNAGLLTVDRHRRGRASSAAWPTSSTTAARSSTAPCRTRGSSRPSGTPTWAPTPWSSSPTRPIRCCRAGGAERRGNNGQAAAAGKASVVRGGATSGTGVVLIGTSPVVRLHAKGLQPQLGRAILWAAAPPNDGDVGRGHASAARCRRRCRSTLGTPATLRRVHAGRGEREYTASTTANGDLDRG